MIIPAAKVPPKATDEARRLEEMVKSNQADLERIRSNLNANHKMFNASIGGTASQVQASKDTILSRYTTTVYNYRQTNFGVPTTNTLLWNLSFTFEPSKYLFIFASHTALINSGSFYNYIYHRVTLDADGDTFIETNLYIDTLGASGYQSGVLPVAQEYDNARGGSVDVKVQIRADSPGVGASVNSVSELTVFVQQGGNI